MFQQKSDLRNERLGTPLLLNGFQRNPRPNVIQCLRVGDKNWLAKCLRTSNENLKASVFTLL